MRNLVITLIFLNSITVFGNTKITDSKTNTNNKTMMVNFDQLKAIINKNDNKLYVINFWATWCKPCVEELPDFMEVNNKYIENAGFKMILVSLDRASELETKVKPFLEKHKINVDTYLLDDNKRMNEWIPAIDSKWSGAIPATVFYKNGKKLDFKENKLDKNTLDKLITQYL